MLFFPDTIATQVGLDTARAAFENLVFYQRLLYNPATNAYLAAVTLNTKIMSSPERSQVVAAINVAIKNYQERSGQTVYSSGLPLIRTEVADRVKRKWVIFYWARYCWQQLR